MTELVVCSGKGGTGKTSVLASFAALSAGGAVLADADVDAANLHLVLAPRRCHAEPFISGHVAVIRQQDCTGCGTCHDLCRFDAIVREPGGDGWRFRVDPAACEGCGVCVHFCPTGAIDFPDARCGEWYLSETPYGPLVHARLEPGAENSGKLVTLVREKARQEAERAGRELILVDGPPGIGCPVTAALTGADVVLLVAEPSLSGLHDLERVVELAAHFGVRALACVNKADLSEELTGRIEQWCAERGVPVAGRIPFDPAVTRAQLEGRSLVEAAPGSAAGRAVRALWERVRRELTGG